MKRVKRIWFYVTSPFVGPGTSAAILREIENLDWLEPMLEGQNSKSIMRIVKLHLRQKMRKILKVSD